VNHHRALGRLTLSVLIALVGSSVGGAAAASSLDRADPRSMASVPGGRDSMGLAYDVDHQDLVLFGGIAQFGQEFMYLGDTWTWDGSGWTQRHPTASPHPSYGTSMAFDEANHEVVLFGGIADHIVSNQTWTWDGTNWTQRHPATSPPAGGGGAMAYDSVGQEVVLLVGDDYNPPTTWTWNGTDWTQETPSTSPPARVWAAGAFDQADGTFVVFGGAWSCGDLGCPLSDTWTWDGTDWTEQHPARHPSARAGAALAFDPNGGGLVLFGRALDDLRYTWTWDGSDWSRSRPVPSPRPRGAAGMACDPGLGTALLFGGVGSRDGSNLYSYDDLWAWDGLAWARMG
jgi:hypothetical protein